MCVTWQVQGSGQAFSITGKCNAGKNYNEKEKR